MSFMYEVKNMLESLKPAGTVRTIQEMLKKHEIEASNFSLKELHNICEEYESKNVREAATADLFPRLTGEIISSTVIAGYNQSGIN